MSKVSAIKPAGADPGAVTNQNVAWLAAQHKKPPSASARPKAAAAKAAVKAPAKAPTTAPNKGAGTASTRLAQAEKRVTDYAKQYEQRAAGKAGVQKAMDWTRKAFNEGYGDDQFKNIGKTQQQLAALKRDVSIGKLSQSQADQAAASVLNNFNREEARVTKAQAQNAEVGKAVHGAGRVGVVAVSAVGATAASGGNVFVGFAAGVGAGSIYDAVTVADQGKSSIAPKLDAGNSLGGVAARKLKGETINGGDVARGTLGTLTDGVNGAFAGQGMLSAKAAQLSVQQAAAQSGTQASRWALAKATAQASTLNSLGQTGATTGLKTLGIAGDQSLTGEQKQQLATGNAVQTLKQLPGQLTLGAVSSHLGVSAQIKNNKVLDAAAQYGMGSATNLVQTSVNNLVSGKGPALSQADVAAAMVQGLPSTATNLAQRVPLRNAQAVVDHSGTMNPYVGTALPRVPTHTDGTTVVVGTLAGKATVPAGGNNNVVHVRDIVSTPKLWSADGPAQGTSRDAGPLHVYRTFSNGLTKQPMVLKVDLGQQQKMGQRDQAQLNQLTKKAGLSTQIPVVPLIDETPSNVLPKTASDAKALAVLKTATVLGQGYGAVVPKSEKAMPSAWLRHFLEGSGEPRVMSQAQVSAALKNSPQLVAWSDAEAGSSALNQHIDAQRQQGATQGQVEGFANHPEGIRTNKAGGWYNSLGSAHVAAVYKGSWKVNTADGSIQFKGEKRWLVQDRYNWEAPGFNGKDLAPAAPVPSPLVKMLPTDYINAFSVYPGRHERSNLPDETVRDVATTLVDPHAGPKVTDALFGHLQMVQRGAQPFWTFGLSAPTAVEFQWTPQTQTQTQTQPPSN